MHLLVCKTRLEKFEYFVIQDHWRGGKMALVDGCTSQQGTV